MQFDHRMIRTFTIMFVIIILMSLTMPIMAQDAQPTLPSAQPTLPADQPEATEDASVDTPASEVTAEAIPLPVTGDTCPTLVDEGFTATELICGEITSNQACIGNGIISATPKGDIEGFAFGQPGDTIALNDLSEIQLQTLGTANSIMAVVRLQPTLPITDSADTAQATVFLFGDATLVDNGDDNSTTSFPSATVQAGGGLNVRDVPNAGGTIIWQLGANEQVIVTGKSADQQWIRIEIPSIYGGAGWVFGRYMNVEGGLEALEFVADNAPAPDITPPEFGSMQTFAFLSAPYDADCTNTPPSGMLIQSPNGFSGNMRFQVNDVTLGLNGAAFIRAQAGESLDIDVLEGVMTVAFAENNSEFMAGSGVSISLTDNLEPTGILNNTIVDNAMLATLPLRLLPRGFAIGDGTTFSSTTTNSNADNAPTTDLCTVSSGDEVRNIRLGPSTDYAVSGILEANSSLTAFAQTRDPLGFIWYETDNGFIRFDTVTVSGNCDDLPAATPVEPPVTASQEETTASPASNSLVSDLLGEICGRTNVQTSLEVDGDDFAYPLGGTWRAAPGTTVTFAVQGATRRGEYGDAIRLTFPDGATLAGSGESNAITVTFNEALTFNTNVSATRGDFVILTANCTP